MNERIKEEPASDGAVISLLLGGLPQGKRKKRIPLELIEIGLSWSDVRWVDYPEARRGCCLRNAVGYIKAHGGTLMLGLLESLDSDMVCCHAWVMTDEGEHIDPTPITGDNRYHGAPDPFDWVATA